MKHFYRRNIACSDSAYLALKRMGLSDKSVVVKNGIELDLIRAARNEDNSEMRLKLGIPADKVVCVNIGRMQSESTGFQKAQDIILSALGEGKLAGKYHIVFLGDGSGSRILKEQSASLGIENSVSFKGVVSNVMDYVACADVMVMPSRWEGLPIAAIEAACSGIPMLLSNIESFDAFDTKSVVKCDACSVDSLIAAMKDVLVELDDLKREASKASAEYRERFSIRNVAAKHLELYRDVLMSS